MKKTAVIICPGRGTYNKDELGYLRQFRPHDADLLDAFDDFRRARGQALLAELDGASRYSLSRHTRGDNASPLIYAASYLDARAAYDNFNVLAVTGNSMGWYIALAAAGAVSAMAGFEVVNTMGTLMQDTLIGGQVLYPFVDDNWQAIAGKHADLCTLVTGIDAQPLHSLGISINLGGMLVLAGNEAGLKAFESAVPPIDGRFPMRLPNHAAFHHALQAPVASLGQAALAQGLFGTPEIPLVDGRGAVWYPRASSAQELRDYTLGHQVTETYDFTKAVQVAAKTFAPDVFIVTGPGATLGGAIAQSLTQIGWGGITDKTGFQTRQVTDPILLSMGRADQRDQVV